MLCWRNGCVPVLRSLLCASVAALQMFFAKVPRTATRQQIQDLFAQFGEVQSLNLFTPYEVRRMRTLRTATAAHQPKHMAKPCSCCLVVSA